MKTRVELTDKELEQVTGGAGSVDQTRVIGLLRNHLGKNDSEEIYGTSSLVGDLGADSLDVVDIVRALEEEFKIHISDTRVLSVRTVNDLCKAIEEKL